MQPVSLVSIDASGKELVNAEQPISRVVWPAQVPKTVQTEDDAPKYPEMDNLETMRAQELHLAS
jgi:hypothetical protein